MAKLKQRFCCNIFYRIGRHSPLRNVYNKGTQVKNHFLTVCLLCSKFATSTTLINIGRLNIYCRKLQTKRHTFYNLAHFHVATKKRLRKAVSFLKIMYYVCNSILQNA